MVDVWRGYAIAWESEVSIFSSKEPPAIIRRSSVWVNRTRQGILGIKAKQSNWFKDAVDRITRKIELIIMISGGSNQARTRRSINCCRMWWWLGIVIILSPGRRISVALFDAAGGSISWTKICESRFPWAHLVYWSFLLLASLSFSLCPTMTIINSSNGIIYHDLSDSDTN